MHDLACLLYDMKGMDQFKCGLGYGTRCFGVFWSGLGCFNGPDSRHLISIQCYWFEQDLRAVLWRAAYAVYAKSPMATGQLAPLCFNPWSSCCLIFTQVNSSYHLDTWTTRSLINLSVTSIKQRDNCIQTINNYLFSGSLHLIMYFIKSTSG